MKKYSLLLLLLLIPYYAFAAEDASAYPNLKFTPIDDGTCSVGANETNRPSGSLIIPAEVNINGNTHNVTSIGNDAFRECSLLTSVVIPECVTSIGNGAFWRCSSLTSVVIPKSVISIDEGAFFNCSSLTSIFIPEGVTSIGKGAFAGCSSLTSVVIPEGVTSIGPRAFRDCSSLTSLVIPKGVASIGEYAFQNCSSLKSLIFKGSTPGDIGLNILRESTNCNVYVPMASLDDYKQALTAANIEEPRIVGYEHYEGDYPDLVFTPIEGNESECSVKAANNGIKGDNGKLVIPSAILKVDGSIYNVTTIEAEAFDDCYALTSITIQEGVTEIEHSAFELCASLTSVKIPNSVTSIGSYAFYTCSSLTSVKIPNSVTSIGKSAFSYCWRLKSLIFTGETCPETLETDILYNSDKCTVYVPEGAIGTYVTALGVDASRVKGYVEESACKELVFTPIEGKDGECSVKKAKNEIKGDNGKLVIPSAILKADGNIYNVTTLEADAFGWCTSLTSVEIPSSVTSIEADAFTYCSKLTSVDIPSSVTSIGDRAFTFCVTLTSVEIPLSVTSIGMYTFAGCRAFTSVEIPSSVTSIGESPFAYCNKLKSLIFMGEKCPETLGKDILNGADNCTVYVPETSVDDYKLKLLNVDASRVKGYVEESACEELVFTSIEGKNGECSVMKANSNIKGDNGKLVIPSTILKDDGNIYNVTSFGDYAFGFCSSLTSVVIPEGVTSIGTGAFIDCRSLTSIVIPKEVTSISEYAFDGCSSLKSLIFKGSECPSLGNAILGGVSGCTVYVVNKTVVESFKAKFPDNEVKPLLDITSEPGTYVKTGDSYNIELTSYPEGYAPEGLSCSVKEEGVTLTEGEDAFTLSGHGAATVRVADAGNENIYAETTLNVYVSGDSNDNGTVDITDAVTTANYIVGKEPEKFLEIAADVVPSDPSAITIADVVATVDIMLAAPAPEPSDDSKALMAPANSVDCLTLRAAREGIALSLAGQGVFSALQADVTLPAGAVLNGVSAGYRLTSNHSVMYRMVDDRTVRVAVFALSLDTFVQGDAVVILDVDGMGTGDVTAANVIASDADGNGYRLGVDGGGMSGIDGVTPGDGAAVSGVDGGIAVTGAAGMTVAVYTMDGRLVKCFTAGDDDRVTVDLVPGVYLVRVGAAPAVKIAVR